MYAEVLVNHAYARRRERLTYEVPQGTKIEEGTGVMIPFQKTEKAGLVLRTHNERPEFETRMITGTLDSYRLLVDWQLKLSDWIAEHYFCSKYDSTRLMLPKNIWRKPTSRVTKFKTFKGEKSKERHELTEKQAEIVKEIIEKKHPVSLVHGVTGAGKTEIYRHLIEKAIERGEQASLLVPEISLTPQLLAYFQGHFENIAVLHSRVSDGQRAAAWREIREGNIQLVIGSRSSLFSPFKNLGVIIMDEEHEWSYKQDSSPRYHAREVAQKMVELTGAQLILGSATPTIETMYKAQSGEFAYFHMNERISGTELPKVHIVDMCHELRAKNYSVLSYQLEEKVRAALAAKEQIILFLNRRGSASATICRDCGDAIECNNCDVKLTYHARKFKHKTLVCHHCGVIQMLPETCPSCKSTKIKHIGVGTEKVEEELKALFPNANIARADRDTMSKKDSYQDLHERLHSKEIDILIGTQMIGKGFDIAGVSLVGVILADLGLHIPDFRSNERNFQLLTQVAGRSGRREKQGEVVIQTYSTGHPSILFSQNHDYLGFYEQEISSREMLKYPPFGKIIKLLFSDPSKEVCQAAANKLIAKLESEDHQVYAAPALIPRIHNKYHWNILIQGPDPRTLIKNLDAKALDGWRIDVDPVQCV
ncbi:MAG: primosomal protein N' (replication factor Y) [Oceanicoccus sp.]|jgi:primosomal protein N' (replication factor Y)